MGLGKKLNKKAKRKKVKLIIFKNKIIYLIFFKFNKFENVLKMMIQALKNVEN